MQLLKIGKNSTYFYIAARNICVNMWIKLLEAKTTILVPLGKEHKWRKKNPSIFCVTLNKQDIHSHITYVTVFNLKAA